MFETYLKAHPDEGKPFLDWVRNEYDPEAIDRIILRHE